MANVPYSGVQTVQPTVDGTGAKPIDVPAAGPNAFGAQIGEAQNKLGEAEKQAGAQTDQLAQKFANIYNDSQARDATTKTAMAMADAEAQFKQLKGNDAVAGLKPFQDQISQIVKDNASGLSLVAQSKYQDDSARLVNNAIYNAGSHVGAQAEAAHVNSMTGSIGANQNLYVMNATNPTGESYLNMALHTQSDLSDTLTPGDINSKMAAMSKTSGGFIDSAVKGLMQTNPDAATKILADHSGTFNYEDVDKNTGKIVTYQVPWMDAAQRAQTTEMMQGEFRRQFADVNASVRSDASMGNDWDKNGFAQAAARAGHSKEYIDSETKKIDSLQQSFGASNARFALDKTLYNDAALAYAGKSPIGVYDPETLKKAYPKDPDKVQDILNQVNQLHQVAGFVGGMGTRTPQQNQAELDKFAPQQGMSIADSIHQQESGGKSDAPANGVSVGGWQVTPGTFALYAKPGEDINNPKDNEAVGRRIIDDLSTKFNGDPARIAVGYFSGEGNVAPAGSTTPWKNDTHDKNGKTVSSYVSDVTGRLNGANFGAQSDLYAKMQTAEKNYYTQLSADPAGTITGNDKQLSAMYQDAATDTKNPQKMNDYVTAMAARQEALQIPEANRSVLPKGYATAITDRLIASPESAPTQLAKMATDYQGNWPSMYKSLVQQGGLPPAYQIVQQLGADPSTDKYGTMFARYLGSDDTKGKTDEVLMGGSAPLKEIREAVAGNSDVKSLTLSLARSGASPSQVSDTVGGVQKLAMAIHFYDPSDSNPAATAIKAMTSKYAYLPDGGARVPIDKLDSIVSNTQATIDNLESRMSPAQFVPETYANRQRYIDDVKSSPSWVTRGSDNKVYLYDHFGRAVLGTDGKQIGIGFDDPAYQKPHVKPSELIQQPNENLGRGEIPVKGSLADSAPTFSEMGDVAKSAGKGIITGIEKLSAKSKEREAEGGKVAEPNDNIGRGEIPAKGSIADILGGN